MVTLKQLLCPTFCATKSWRKRSRKRKMSAGPALADPNHQEEMEKDVPTATREPMWPAAERIDSDRESFEESAEVEESNSKTSPEPNTSERDLNGNLIPPPNLNLASQPADCDLRSHVKPSYQVISVREPIAKMLAGRSNPSSILYEEIGVASNPETPPVDQPLATEERPSVDPTRDIQPPHASPIYSVINKSAKRARNAPATGSRPEHPDEELSWPPTANGEEHTYSSLAGSQSSYVLYEEIRAQGSSSSSLYDQIQSRVGYETIAARPSQDHPLVVDSERAFARLPAVATGIQQQQQVGQDIQEQSRAE